ncbi:hypothetical protein F5146DRAFT_220476 [Armillaria mellea]|nr:hypothetical protein F5146DRAFT_220476 [Armillaria mellea]
MAMHSDSAPASAPSPLSRDRVQDLLRCNDPLLEDEKTALRSLVDDAPSALANLDRQITETPQKLDSLILKRQIAESDFDDAKTLLHPMRSMPHDVLAVIFHQCLPNYRAMPLGVKSPYDSLDPRLAPWSISHVSKSWRDIALSLPHLWKEVTLDFRKYGALSMRTLLTKVALLLQRSKDVDLFVTLLSPNKSLSDHPAFALLDISAPRWKALSVYIQRTCLQALSGTSFTRLQDLFAMVYPINKQHVGTPVDTFQKADSLRLATILGNETGISFPLPWSGILNYGCDLYGRGRWDCLKQLTTLRSLDITSLLNTTCSLSELPQTTLPTVRILRISERDCNPGAEIIAKLIQSNVLVLPSLSRLSIHFRRYGTPSFPLSHQLPNSLTSLVIRDAMEDLANTGRVLQFLQTVSHVKKLVIYGRCGDEFFQGISIQPGKDIILPNLLALRLQRDRERFPVPVVLDFIESRCRRDDGDDGHGAVNDENRNASRPRLVSLQEIDLSEVELVPEYRNRLNDLRQRVKIIYTC